jgi:hypothetical protein
MRGELVLHAVSGQEGHPPSADLADGERGGGLPVRRIDIDAFDVLEEGVEARAPEDPDLGGGRAQADFPLVEGESDEDDLLSEELLLDSPELLEPEPSDDDEEEEDEEVEGDFFRLSVR